jgi:uncharacterized protein Yka (UPF0111/DUF47 family)
MARISTSSKTKLVISKLFARLANFEKRCDNVDLELLLKKLYRNEVSPAIIEAIEQHCAVLSRSIARFFSALNAAMTRNEPLIRKR